MNFLPNRNNRVDPRVKIILPVIVDHMLSVTSPCVRLKNSGMRFHLSNSIQMIVIVLSNKNHTNSRNDYTEDDIIKMMEFLIDIIVILFGDMMLQHTIYNRKNNWNKQSYSPLLTVYNIIYFNIYIINWICLFFQVFVQEQNYQYQFSGLWRSIGLRTFVSGLNF
jgi:hypothetical protein